VLGFGYSLLNEVEDKAGRDKGHGENNTDCHHSVHRSGQPEGRSRQDQYSVYWFGYFNATTQNIALFLRGVVMQTHTYMKFT